MRRIVLVGLVTWLPSAAWADRWLDLAPLPDLEALEAALPLERDAYLEDRGRLPVFGELAVGAARKPGDPLVAAGAVAAGHASDTLLLAGRSELVWGLRAAANDTGAERLSGRHEVISQLRFGRYGEAGALALASHLEHGRARALAPVAKGPGRRIDGQVDARALVHLGKGDFASAVTIDGGLGTTRWLDAPGLDRAERRGVGLGLGMASTDGELPRGVIHLLRGRVEHQAIQRTLVAAGSVLAPGTLRTLEIGAGVDDLTLHIDRERLAVISVDLGWSWLEADTPTGTLRDDLLRLRLAGATKWLHDDGGTRQVGLALARAPGTSADGTRLVTDWRLALTGGAETARYALRASGGISWLRSLEGGQGPAPRMPRYGVELEAFRTLGLGIELGAYHATWFEPPLAGDPWATPRQVTSETGLLLRWQSPGRRRATRPRHHPVCGGVIDPEPADEERVLDDNTPAPAWIAPPNDGMLPR